MFREINVAGFVLKNGWVFCQITFLIYMIILAVMDIKRRQVHLGFLLSGIIWVILSVICERTVSTGEIIAGILAGAFFLLISKLTKESFGYGDSILIVIMGAFLGFRKCVETFCRFSMREDERMTLVARKGIA